MASSLSPVGRVYLLKTLDPCCNCRDIVVRSIGLGESSNILYNPQELTFMVYINDLSYKNIARLTYA